MHYVPMNIALPIAPLRYWFLILFACIAMAGPGAAPAQTAARPPLVLAAASLQESLEAASDAWAAKGHARPRLAFASSSALVRQILAGAPADLFISADVQAMNQVAAARRVDLRSRQTLARNQLALIAPSRSRALPDLRSGASLAAALGRDGRLAMGDPASVPAGRYARAALTTLDLWPAVANRLALGDNVRAALSLVERGEAPLGIVYATDARASGTVRLVALFPAASHPPIVYPVARLSASASRDAEPFRRFLVGREGRAIFTRFGFH